MLIIAALLILSFFPLWAIVRLPDWETEQEDREQEEYSKKWLENHGK